MSLMDATLAPDLSAAPPHVLDATDEAFYVIDDTVGVLAGDDHVNAGPGAFLYVARGTVHAFANTTSQVARTLAFHFAPGFEGFYEELGEPAAAAEPPARPVGAPDFARIMTLASKCEMRIVPP